MEKEIDVNVTSKDWLIDWFMNNAGASFEEVSKKISQNYLQTGWIDSLKFITFVMEIEQEFGINFSNEEFQNREFSTIDGLTRLIDQKVSNR